MVRDLMLVGFGYFLGVMIMCCLAINKREDDYDK